MIVFGFASAIWLAVWSATFLGMLEILVRLPAREGLRGSTPSKMILDTPRPVPGAQFFPTFQGVLSVCLSL